MYHIVADSGCDLFTLKNASFSTASLIISTDKTRYPDDEHLDTAKMVEELLAYKGRSFTACPSSMDWLSAFTPSGGAVPDEIYVVTLTSGLSGTYNSAMIAADMYREEHPNTRVLVIDSLSVGPEMVLLLEKIVELKESGKTFDEVEAEIKKYSASVRLFFAFRSLHNLAQNGRVNKLVAAAAGVLGISVYGTANEEGHIAQLGKTRGAKNVIASLIQQMNLAGCTGRRFRISHTENEKLAEDLQNAIKERYPDADIEIHAVRGLCAYYCERGGIVVACETA